MKVEEAFKMGQEAYGKNIHAPCLNKEFMDLLPNCVINNKKIMKLRVKLYKNYIKGWTIANLNASRYFE